ncbi:metallophosphatase domain-containing protein [Marinobacter koreensis]|uniref:Metallophosphatase domain-containing protein n=1 Tax=Marinobacter koreensis TaxID=335974 RepID=A0ABW0RT47_9GAMM|nr:metallophosphatase domain-containing protein [Marinobacter koreensis]MCK7548903.1 metallophosphatase domain-containing protein [Marinobacter koreensis]MDX1817045.1 metallophosphatase domain-containing protein [Marinobacter sp.]
MRIVCISDTHGMHRQIQVPEGDLLIHAGDSLARGTLDDLEDLDDWLAGLPHRHKILIAGNHDWCFQDEPEEARDLLKHACYLQDGGIEIEGFRFWGSPWTPVFFNWAFNLERGEALAERWARIPENLDVLITHGPPAGILDIVPDAKGELSVGCEELATAVENRQPRLHIFGHIHESYGQKRQGNSLFVNASTCTGSFKPLNPPVVLDL